MSSRHTIELVLKARDEGVESTLSKINNKADGFGSKLKAGLGFGAWMEIGKRAVGAVFNSISSNMDGAVKRLDTLNNFPKVMQSLGFSADDAKKGIDSLANGIDHLPTTLDAVASQAQQFVPMTGNIEKATQVTLALNNAMAAGGKSAQEQQNAIAQWTKAMAKGKPDFEMWQSMVQTAPAQMDQLAKSMLGASANQNDLYEAMKSGSVSIDEVNDKMIELTNASDGFDIAGKHYDNFAEQAKNASAGIQMSMLNIKAAVQRNIANVLSSIDTALAATGGISGSLMKIVPAINTVGDTITKMISKDLSFEDGMKSLIYSISSSAGNFVTSGMEIVTNIMTGLSDAAPSILMAMSVCLQNLMNKIIEGAPTFVSAGMKLVGSLVTGLGNALPSLITKGVSLLLSLVSAIGQNLPTLIVTGLNAVTNLIKGLTSGQGAVASKAVSIAGKIISAFIAALPQILSAGLNLMVALLRGIVSGFSAIPSRLLGLARKIPSAIKSGAGSLASIGGQMISGLWNGISAKFNSVISRVKGMAARLPKAVKAVLGIHSPSRVFRSIGEYTGEGLAIGIESTQRRVQKAVNNMVDLASLNGMQMAAANGFNGTLNSEYEYSRSASFEVVVPLEVNGREIARATASEMDAAINSLNTRSNRRRGIK